MSKAPFIIHTGIITKVGKSTETLNSEVYLKSNYGEIIQLYKNEYYDDLLSKNGQAIKLLGWQYPKHFVIEYYRVFTATNKKTKQRRV